MPRDGALLQQYSLSRDAEAFSELVRRHADMVYGTSLRITGNPHDAEDVAQECFLEFARKAHQVTSSIAGWLYETAAHRSLDYVRDASTRKRHEEAPMPRRPDANEPTWSEIAPHIDEALSELSEEIRALLVLHYLEDRSQEEAADELGVNQSTVSRRLEKGVGELREKLRKAGVVASVALLATLLGQEAAHAAPATLVASLGKMAIAGIGKGAIAGVATKATAVGLAALKTKIIVATAAAVIVIGGIVAHNKLSEKVQKAPTQPVGAATEDGSALSGPAVESAEPESTAVAWGKAVNGLTCAISSYDAVARYDVPCGISIGIKNVSDKDIALLKKQFWIGRLSVSKGARTYDEQHAHDTKSWVPPKLTEKDLVVLKPQGTYAFRYSTVFTSSGKAAVTPGFSGFVDVKPGTYMMRFAYRVYFGSEERQPKPGGVAPWAGKVTTGAVEIEVTAKGKAAAETTGPNVGSVIIQRASPTGAGRRKATLLLNKLALERGSDPSLLLDLPPKYDLRKLPRLVVGQPGRIEQTDEPDTLALYLAFAGRQEGIAAGEPTVLIFRGETLNWYDLYRVVSITRKGATFSVDCERVIGPLAVISNGIMTPLIRMPLGRLEAGSYRAVINTTALTFSKFGQPETATRISEPQASHEIEFDVHPASTSQTIRTPSTEKNEVGEFLARTEREALAAAPERQPVTPPGPGVAGPVAIRFHLDNASLHETVRELMIHEHRVHVEYIPMSRTRRPRDVPRKTVDIAAASLADALDQVCKVFAEYTWMTCRGVPVIQPREGSALGFNVIVKVKQAGTARELLTRFLEPHELGIGPFSYRGPATRPPDVLGFPVSVRAGSYSAMAFLCAVFETQEDLVWTVSGSTGWIGVSYAKISAAVSYGWNVRPQTRAREARGRIASGKPPAGARVTIPDRGLEVRLREAIGKRRGDLYESDMEAFERLNAWKSKITDLSGLEGARNLIWLSVPTNAITDISPLARVKGLLSFHASNNSIADLSPLSGMLHLSTLRLGKNRISDISPLAGLRHLFELHLNENSISDVSALAGKPELRRLSLFDNSISDIVALAGCTDLEELDLRDNSVEDISALSRLTKLKKLWLQNNSVRNIASLAGLTNLTEFTAGGNAIGDISPLADLTGLEKLYLPNNDITDISALAKLTKLKSVFLGGNSIKDITALVVISDAGGLGKGAYVSLSGNPLSDRAIDVDIPRLHAAGATVDYDTRDGRSVTLEGVDNPWKVIATAGETAAKPRTEDKMLPAQKIKRLLERRITFETIDTPISEIIPWLQGRSGIPMRLDSEAVEKLFDPRVSIKVKDIPFKSSLDNILRQAGLGYAVRDGGLFISTPENLRAKPSSDF